MAGQLDAISHDPTVYPVEDDVGEDLLQRLIVELLRPLMQRWLDERGVFLVGADQFIYYRQFHPTQRYAPDVYVLPGVAPSTHVPSWKAWETGIVPSLAVEIVSGDWEKDYIEAPQRCADIGVQELIVFDPRWSLRPRGEGARWQVFRRDDAGFARVERTDADRIRSQVLGCWLRSVGEDMAERVRLATGSRGDALVPTAEEAALARVAELEAELARLRNDEP